MRVVLGALLILSVPACFEPAKPACVFLCGAGGECPDGYACGTDGRCHRMESGGQLATCEDQLPVDATVDVTPPDARVDGGPDGNPDGAPDGAPDAAPDARIDASPPDAPVDASPPDAMVDAEPNVPPVLTLTPSDAMTTVRAGDTVTIVASATDGNTGDTLTFSAAWAGTNRNPFQADPASGGFFSFFNPGTRTFTMSSGPVGTFDVRITVNDGHGGTDSQDVRIVVLTHHVVLNEIALSPDAIELLNTGPSAVDVTGWVLLKPSSTAESFVLPASTTIAAGGFLVVHWGQAGTDTSTELFTGTSGHTSLAAIAQVILYAPTSDFTISRLIRDFIRWASIAGGRTDQAVYAGQWPNTTDVVTTTGLMNGYSLSRTPGANTETPADWYVEDTPTLGAANAP